MKNNSFDDLINATNDETQQLRYKEIKERYEKDTEFDSNYSKYVKEANEAHNNAIMIA